MSLAGSTEEEREPFWDERNSFDTGSQKDFFQPIKTWEQPVYRLKDWDESRSSLIDPLFSAVHFQMHPF